MHMHMYAHAGSNHAYIAIYDCMYIMYVCVYIYIFRKRKLSRNMSIHRVIGKLFDHNARRGIFVDSLQYSGLEISMDSMGHESQKVGQN